MDDRIDELVSAMTLEEKVAMTAGSDVWHTVGVERLGIPRIKVTDGPSGARGEAYAGGSTSASFPCGTAIAATWDVELVGRIGAALAEQARSKGAQVLLGPTVNMHRSPLAGRNFETYSEDPHLAARIAVAYITALQAGGVAATVKHFVCNDSEFERMTISSEVSERALREIYLPPFEAAVTEARTWAIMTAYNRINGTYASENEELIHGLLEADGWAFDGVVMSDWFGTHSTVEAANAGLDLEMPGPGRHLGPRLLEPVQSGQVREDAVDGKVRRLLRLASRTGLLDRSDAADVDPEEESLDRPEDRSLIREAAASSMVLLHNDGGLLPLDPAVVRTLAVIGPNAVTAQIQGGGSAQVNPHYAVSPLDGICARAASSGLQVGAERGCHIHRGVPPLDVHHATTANGRRGLLVEYFAGSEATGVPVRTAVVSRGHFTWIGAPARGIDPGAPYALRISATFTADDEGTYALSLVSTGRSRLFLDGELLLDTGTSPERGTAFYGLGSKPVTADVPLRAGESRQLVVEFSAEAGGGLGGVSIGCAPPAPDDLMERAVELASRCDAAVVVVGTTHEWESEGADRTSMDLPGAQAELIERVTAANPRTAVVVNAGAPVTMDWAERAAAVLQMWFPGQEGGHALADVLFGDVDPGGRLPTTFPVRLEDTPAFAHYPGSGGKVEYEEDIFVGYRHYDTIGVEPRYCFGHGLSYTTFEYGELRIEPGDGVGLFGVSVDVTNTGSRRGREVVQLYVRPVSSRLPRPDKELKAFAKVDLDPGQTETVTFHLNHTAFQYWDPGHGWTVEDDHPYELVIGASSRDIRGRARVELRR